MIHSKVSPIVFFHKISFVIEFIIIIKNLHQSKAGIGNKLNIHKLIEMIAQIININIIHSEIEDEIKSTIQIGQLTCCKASSLSLGVSGTKIFQRSSFSHLKVNIDWL